MVAILLVTLLSVTLVALNLYATLRLYRSTLYSRGQKVAQVALTWLIPIFGALLVLRVMTDEPLTHEEHFEQFEHSDRIDINGEPTPWSGRHDTTL